VKTSNLILDFEFDQHLESHKHVINIIMWFRDMGCYSRPLHQGAVFHIVYGVQDQSERAECLTIRLWGVLEYYIGRVWATGTTGLQPIRVWGGAAPSAAVSPSRRTPSAAGSRGVLPL
jgi:hypothetical protein